ncbi:MAG: membrane protein insertase YidC, partial [Candidatus Omnitrophota bacterium]
MEKRTILAIVLSMAVLLGWSLLMPKPQHIINKEVMATVQSSVKPLEEIVPVATVSPSEPAAPESIVKFINPEFEVSFLESRAAIKEVSFKKFQSHVFVVGQGFELEDTGLNFSKISQGPDQVTFVHSDKDKVVTKKFNFSKSNYTIGLELTIRNRSGSDLKMALPLLVGTLDFSLDPKNSTYQDITAATIEKILHPNSKKNHTFNNLKFISIRDRYFCFIVQPDKGEYTGYAKAITKQQTRVSIDGKEIELKPGTQIGHFYASYLGPQEFKAIKSINPDWTAVMYFGTFDFIAQLLLQLLEFLHGLVHNWGLAIVLLSLLIYLLLFPLSIKQMRSMKEMQALQPRIEALRKEHKDNPQKLNKEIMELYK